MSSQAENRTKHPALRYRRLWLSIGWVLVVLVIYLSLGDVPVTPEGVVGADKLGHLIAYGTLMGWFSHIIPERRKRWGIAAALIGLGIGLEFLQALTPNRSFEVADMLADAAGVIGGWVLAPPRIVNLLEWFERRL